MSSADPVVRRYVSMSAENGVLTYRRAAGSVRVVIADGTTNFAHGYPASLSLLLCFIEEGLWLLPW